MPELRSGADAGEPVAVIDPDGEAAAAFAGIAEEVEKRKPRLRSHPQLVIS